MGEETIAIVGAGVAGLTLAHRLLEAGVPYPVVIIEKEREVGGLARSFTYRHADDDFTFDIGPHRFHSDDPAVVAYILKTLELDHIEIPRTSGVWMYDRYHDWPLRLATITKLPLWLMLRCAAELFHRRKAETASFEDYIIDRYGRTLYQVFFKPYTEKFTGYPCSQLHATWAEAGIDRAVIDNRIRAGNLLQIITSTLIPKPVETKFIYPKTGGISRFCHYLERGIHKRGGRILRSSQVTAVDTSATAVQRITINGAQELPVKFLFWSATIPALLELLGLADGLPEMGYLATVLANYFIDGPPQNKYQWCYFGTPDAPVARVSSPGLFNRRNVPTDKHALCVELPCVEGGETWNRAERLDAIIEKFLVKTRMVDRAADFLDVRFERIPNSYPIYTLHYQAKLKRIVAALRKYTNVLNFGRTGGFWYNNLDHSIQQAMRIGAAFMQQPDTFNASLMPPGIS